MSTRIDEAKATLIAKDILASVKILNEYLKEIDEDPMQAMQDQIVVEKMVTQSAVLYKKLCDNFNAAPNEHAAAFEKVFTFPSRFKSPASVEIILAFIYGMIFRYESVLMSTIFRDAGHIAYAQNVLSVNKGKIAAYLK